EAGLQTMVLKGAALSTLYYRDTGARPMLDFDVLVHTGEATTALDVLERAGWRLTAGLSRRQLLASRHSMALVAPDGLSVDLHWRALDQPARDDDFWDGAERLGHRAAWGRRSRTAFAAETWDRYRRLRTAEHDSPVPDGFLSFLADYLGHASRGRMLAHAARRALSRTRRP